MSEGPSWKLLTGVALGAAALTAVVTTVAMHPADDAAEGEAIRTYLLAHPEVIPEAIGKLRQRESDKVAEANRQAIETPYAGAWAGAKDGDVVLVQYYDYACTYCRASLADVRRLIAEDKRLKVVFRDYPILSEGSVTAARVSLAAAEQGRFLAFHDAMYAAGRPDEAGIGAAAQKAGLNAGAAEKAASSTAVEQELASNAAMARQIGFSGTPAWVIGGRTLSGNVGYAALKAAIAEARRGS